MAYEKKDGDISVFMQRDKKNDKAPDWKGEALIDGKTYEVAFWAKGNTGTMLAGSIKPARDKTQDFRGSGSASVSRHRGDDPSPFSDEIPF